MPKVTLGKWKKEIEMWCPSLRTLLFYGSQEERENIKINEMKEMPYDCILTTFETAMKEKGALNKLQFEYLILDEA